MERWGGLFTIKFRSLSNIVDYFWQSCLNNQRKEFCQVNFTGDWAYFNKSEFCMKLIWADDFFPLLSLLSSKHFNKGICCQGTRDPCVVIPGRYLQWKRNKYRNLSVEISTDSTVVAKSTPWDGSPAVRKGESMSQWRWGRETHLLV